MPIYHQCNMKLHEHIIAYIIGSAIGALLIFIFYHRLLFSIIVGALIGIYIERTYADSTIKKRQRNLRLQFRTFLESMCVSTRSGSSLTKALEAALDDLKISYNADSDIVQEINNIVIQYKNGGVAIAELFNDFAERSGLEDIANFASIYEVIEGKNNRITEIISETSEIIGDKIEIEQEIETSMTSAKSETTMMLVMPIIVVLAMTFMGGGLLDSLFTTTQGFLATTVAVILFAASYVLSNYFSNIDL